MSIPNSPTQFRMHSDCSECVISLVVTSPKMSIFGLVTTASPVYTWCIIAEIQMHRHTPGPGSYLLIAKRMHFDVDHNFPPVPHIIECIYFVCTFIYACNTPCGDHLSNLIFLFWSPRATQCPYQTLQHNFVCILIVLSAL